MSKGPSKPKNTRYYFKEVQNYVGDEIAAALKKRRSRAPDRLTQKNIVHEINDSNSGKTLAVREGMFSKMRSHGDVADDHVRKFIVYFDDDDFIPGFAQRVEQERQKLLAELDSGPSATKEVRDYVIRERGRREWLVYEVAFLWHDQPPPPLEVHQLHMTPQISQTKNLLHRAIDEGKLRIEREFRNQIGYTRWVSFEALRELANSIGEKPAFLFDTNLTKSLSSVDSNVGNSAADL